MAARLTSLDHSDLVFSFDKGQERSLGRQKDLKIADRNVSREHCLVTYRASSAGHHLYVKANKKTYILHRGKQQPDVIGPSEVAQLDHGDSVYLSFPGGNLQHGFKVELPQGRDASTQSKGPSLKRTPSLQKEEGSPSQKGGEGPEDPAAAVPATNPESFSHSGIFAGLKFVFWSRSFMGPLITRAQQAGADVGSDLDPQTTTHVIAVRDFSAMQATRKLAELDLDASACYRLDIGDGKVLSLPEGVHYVTPQFISDCLAQGQLLPEDRYFIDVYRMAILASIAKVSHVSQSSSQGAILSGFSDLNSSSQQKLGTAEDASGAVAAATAGENTPGQSAPCSHNAGQGAAPNAQTAALLGRSAEQLKHEWRRWQENGLFPAGAERLRPGGIGAERDHGSQACTTSNGRPQSSGRLVDAGATYDEISKAAHRAVRAQAAQGTVPSDEKPPPATLVDRELADSAVDKQPQKKRRVAAGKGDWGTNGVWDEPYDEASARETVQKLQSHWHRQDLRNGGQVSNPTASAAEEATAPEVPTTESQREAAAKDQDIAATINTACAHKACSAKDFCIVAQLQEVKHNYRKGKDQFKIKAIDRAIQAVEGVQQPLRTAADCRQLGVGEKSIEKLEEIVSTGAYRRNQMLALDPHQQAIKLFMEVWGTGEATAERWYREGCSTLDNIRQRTDLTSQQRTGLKYFEDLQKRIPRKEVAIIEADVREAAIDVLQCRDKPDVGSLFCRAVGSYIRGKPETGDVDMLILPPPSCIDFDSGHALHALCSRLHDQGLLVDDVTGPPQTRGSGAATFLGIVHHPASPCARRLDIKFYPREYLAFAVMHFIGSGAFSRALRYWARSSPIAAREAAKLNALANGFKLSDYGLVPIQKKETVRKGNSYQNVEVELGPSVECKCEGDIFRALGLSYVPPHMRYFHNFE